MKILNYEGGQTLITLLIFMVIAITITSAAVIVSFSNSLSTGKLADGNTTYSLSENGAENAILQLLRNPSYRGETIVQSQGTSTITVSFAEPNTYTILSKGSFGNFLNTISITLQSSNSALKVTSWGQI